METAAGMYARAVLSFQPKFGGVFPRVLQNLATFILFLGKDSKTIIWSPKVEVPNAIGLVSSKLNDDATSIMLLRESEEYLPEDFSLSNEGMQNCRFFEKKIIFHQSLSIKVSFIRNKGLCST